MQLQVDEHVTEKLNSIVYSSCWDVVYVEVVVSYTASHMKSLTVTAGFDNDGDDDLELNGKTE